MGEAKRLELSVELNGIMVACGNPKNVYFQPGPDLVMAYPCIVYERDNGTSAQRADNLLYGWMQRYLVKYIDYEPDSDVFDKLLELPYSAFNRHFKTSGLNHDVFVIYH